MALRFGDRILTAAPRLATPFVCCAAAAATPPLHFAAGLAIWAVEAYSRCVADLLPASFAHPSDSIGFASATAKARLDLVAQYVNADRTVVRVRVDG